MTAVCLLNSAESGAFFPQTKVILPISDGTAASIGRLLNGNKGRKVWREVLMLKWAIIFFLISLVAGALGFTGVARGAAGIAKILFVVFLVIAVIFLILLFAGVAAVS